MELRYGRRGVFGENDKLFFAAAAPEKAAEVQKSARLFPEIIFLLVGRPLEKPAGGDRAAPLEKVAPK